MDELEMLGNITLFVPVSDYWEAPTVSKFLILKAVTR